MKITFFTREEAFAALTNAGLEKKEGKNLFRPFGIYVLRHNEYSAPEYKVRKYRDGYGIHASYFFYADSFHVPQNGRVGISDYNHIEKV